MINFSLRITFKKDPNSSLGFEASIQFTVLERRIWFIFCTFDKLLKNIDGLNNLTLLCSVFVKETLKILNFIDS